MKTIEATIDSTVCAVEVSSVADSPVLSSCAPAPVPPGPSIPPDPGPDTFPPFDPDGAPEPGLPSPGRPAPGEPFPPGGPVPPDSRQA